MKKTTATLVAGLVASALATGVGTYAAFSDTEQAAAQSVSAGTLDLGVMGVGTAGFDVGEDRPGGPMRPGAPSRKQVFKLTNSGSVPGTVTLSMVGLEDRDAGCNEPEEEAERKEFKKASGNKVPFDTAECADGPGSGELSTPLIMTVKYVGVPAGQACPTVPDQEARYSAFAKDRRTSDAKGKPIKAEDTFYEGDSVAGVPGRGVFDLGGLQVGRSQDLCVLARVNLPKDADNLVQSDRTTFDLRFDLTQS